jgi:hypothetical protein
MRLFVIIDYCHIDAIFAACCFISSPLLLLFIYDTLSLLLFSFSSDDMLAAAGFAFACFAAICLPLFCLLVSADDILKLLRGALLLMPCHVIDDVSPLSLFRFHYAADMMRYHVLILFTLMFHIDYAMPPMPPFSSAPIFLRRCHGYAAVC